MNSEVKICHSCEQDFVIKPEDFAFYERIQVPPPTWCPECRNIRRMAWREERTLYKDTCKMCGKSIVSIHAPEGPFTIYCRDCWKSDKWDPLDYGQSYDFAKPFFKQYRKLMEAVPRPALTGSNMVNSEFSHACESVKNCYFLFWSYFSEDSGYCYALLLSRNTYNSYVVDNSNHVNESLHSNRLYKVNYGYFADECLNSNFLFSCVGCSDCFCCTNLRKQKYRIFNEQLSKEEYKEKIKYWDLGSYTRLKEAQEKFRKHYLQTPRKFAHILNSQNVTGDVIRDAKDCDTCFSALDGVQNCKYMYFGGLNLKDSQDVSVGGATSELLYEIFGNMESQKNSFCAGGGGSQNNLYCDWAVNSTHLFGCIGLTNKKYCILNKQYTKEKYEELLPKIKKHMDDMPYVDKKGRVYKFGEFFPTELSAYAYNEAFAFSWYPKTKNEVLSEGWDWRESQARDYKITIKPEQLPDHIRDTKDSILEKIIGCEHEGRCNEQCTTAFRVNREELEFYRSMNVALPRLCPNCRYSQRLTWRNGFHLYKRRCMCAGTRSENKVYENTSTHLHGDGACPNQFETTFSPQKPEIVYCEECYRSEFL